jgi:branched-subunit amino acid transport protein
MGGGILSATGSLIKYIALPMFLIYLVRRVLPDLPVDFGPFITGTIVVGIAMTIISFVHGYYWKGSQQRLIAGLVGVVLAIIWILIIVGGFDLGAAFDTFSFRLDMSGMFLIIAAVISFVEYPSLANKAKCFLSFSVGAYSRPSKTAKAANTRSAAIFPKNPSSSSESLIILIFVAVKLPR